LWAVYEKKACREEANSVAAPKRGLKNGNGFCLGHHPLPAAFILIVGETIAWIGKLELQY
jgi:hypothetical protein